MCGIAGYADFSSKTNPKILRSMTDGIIYRGPDSQGAYFSKDKIAALGVRRLSIIDLVTGDQLISNEDGTITVVYNGEIYNYQGLRKNLIKKGHKFKTKSDTETLVHLYEEYGENMTKYLNGMFVFAIWDEKKQKLFIARDRAGIKPLYYLNKGKLLVFGSGNGAARGPVHDHRGFEGGGLHRFRLLHCADCGVESHLRLRFDRGWRMERASRGDCRAAKHRASLLPVTSRRR